MTASPGQHYAFGLLFGGFTGLMLGGLAVGVSHAPSPAELLLLETPYCPDAGTYTWSIDLDESQTDLVELAQRVLAERDWSHIEARDLGHVINRQNMRGGFIDYPQTTVTARCIPGAYDPATGRITREAV